MAIMIIIILIVQSSKYHHTKNKEACLSLTFDDMLESHYTTVYPLLREKNFGATFFIFANITEDPDKLNRKLMNREQIQELADIGFEIGSHTLTHPILTELNEEQIEKEIKESKKILEENYNIDVYSIAFPYSQYDSKVIEIAKKYYINGRTIYNIKPEGFLINSLALKEDTSSKIICEYINYAEKENLWLVLIFHDIIETPKKWDISSQNFKEILECVENSKIKVESLISCKNKLN